MKNLVNKNSKEFKRLIDQVEKGFYETFNNEYEKFSWYHKFGHLKVTALITAIKNLKYTYKNEDGTYEIRTKKPFCSFCFGLKRNRKGKIEYILEMLN